MLQKHEYGFNELKIVSSWSEDFIYFSLVGFVVCIQQSDLFHPAQHQYIITNTLVLAKTNVLVIVCWCAKTE